MKSVYYALKYSLMIIQITVIDQIKIGYEVRIDVIFLKMDVSIFIKILDCTHVK